jgi:acyl-CoA reductase-like NAD-dependent aldehyde dehydrogenase
MITASTPANALPDILERCRVQQRAWASLPVRRRLRPVQALRRLLVAECDRLCAAVTADVGKPADETVAADVLPLAAACRFLQREAPRLLKPRRVPLRLRPLWLLGQGDTVHRRPRGVVGIIGTWNYPLILNGVQILQAVTAGNGVLWKPSEVAPASAAAFCGLLGKAGFPEGLVHMMPATRAGGQELADADVDHVVFTGSSATGRRLAEHLGRRLVSSTLELSGCDPLILLEDADVALAARAAWFGATLNRGQTCLAVRRVFVPRGLYQPFLAALAPLHAAAAPMPLALASQAQQAERLVDAALADGARLLGAARPGGGAQACPPTVVLDARPEMALCQEASFAPLLAVLPFDTVEEALRMNEVCPYGLGASIFTRNPERATQLSPRLRAGAVVINDVILATAHPATPFGGRGESGWGVTQGAEGLLEMTVPQVVSVRGGTFRPHYQPVGSPGSIPGEVLRGMLAFSHAGSLAERWRGLWRLVRGWGRTS